MSTRGAASAGRYEDPSSAQLLQDRLRLLLRGEIIWLKGRGSSGSCAWGSFQRPGNPVLRDECPVTLPPARGARRVVDVDPVIAEAAQPRGDGVVVGHDHAALGRRHLLDGVEAEDREVRERPDGPAAIRAADRVRVTAQA